MIYGESHLSRLARRFGKHPKKFSHKNLLMARYMPMLPTPPSAVDRSGRLPADIGMMLNDKYGICAVAAAAHQIQSWTTYAERGMLTIPDADLLKDYFVLSPNDDGCYLLDVLNYWRKTGIGGEKIEAFVEVSPANMTEHELAIDHFGGVYIGMSLPDINTFGPWLVPNGPPNPWNGHGVELLSYDRTTRMFKVATWGEIWDVSYEWIIAYCDEGYAVLDDISLIIASGKSPSGFNWAQLQADLLHIKDPVTPPAPDPVPVTPPIAARSWTITVVMNPNYIVQYAGIPQSPSHYSAMEACEHASNLKLSNPMSEVLIEVNGRWKVDSK